MPTTRGRRSSTSPARTGTARLLTRRRAVDLMRVPHGICPA